MKFRRLFPFLFLSLLIASPGFGAVTTNTWVGTSAFFWTNGPGWSQGHVPAAGETVAITNRTLVLTQPTARMASFLIENGTLLFTNWTATLNADAVEIGNGGILTLPGAFINGSITNRINVVCDTFLMQTGGLVNADGKGFIQQNGPGASPTVTTISSGGAGHGGIGGISGHGSAGGVVYNSASNPVMPGSGGGKTTSCSGGSGGGVVRIEASQTITLHGILTANGTAGTSANNRDGGGGSGGSILLLCQTFVGTNGLIRANGARTSSLAGGGGGGRIALHYNPSAQALLPTPSVVFQVTPGLNGYAHKDRFRMADFGTLYFTDSTGVFSVSPQISGFSGHLVFPTGLGAFTANSLTLTNAYLGFDENPFTFNLAGTVRIETNAGIISRYATTLSCSNLSSVGLIKLGSNSAVTIGRDLVVTNGELILRWGSTLTVSNNLEESGSSALFSLQGTDAGVTGRLALSSGATFHLLGAPTNGTPEAWGARLRTGDDLVLESGSWIHPFSDAVNGGAPVFQCRRLLVDASSGFNADGKGFGPNLGPSVGVYDTDTPAGGGGHGGNGGQSSSGMAGGVPNDSTEFPVHAGSGGGSTGYAFGGAGGGVIRIEAEDLILVNGLLTANGLAGQSDAGAEGGGGAGGTIRLHSQLFAATNGLLQANGGRNYGSSAVFSGAGGGGRISIHYSPPDQALLDRPSVRIMACAGDQKSLTRQWLTADWGTIFLSDATAIFQKSNTLAGFGGYLSFPAGLGALRLNDLFLTNAFVGFDESPFELQITNGLMIATNAGLITRGAATLMCSTITNLNILKVGPGSSLTVTGDLTMVQSETTLGWGSSLRLGGSWNTEGQSALICLQSSDAAITGSFRLRSGATLHMFGAPTNGTTGAWSGRLATARDILLESGSWIMPYSDSINGGSPLFQCRQFLIEPDCGVNADGKGYAPTRGPGGGPLAATTTGSGGGHGGRGGNASSGLIGGSPYGNPVTAWHAGSGGGQTTSSVGGWGGGVIRIEAGEQILVNGLLTANGTSGGAYVTREAGGGAGGSVYLLCGTLAGAGQIKANGGQGLGSSAYSGGGGGGRISIQYNPGLQAVAGVPPIRFSTSAGYQLPIARQWQMADWGSLCFPDAVTLFRTGEIMNAFSGYVTITNGMSAYAVQSLTVTNSVLGFDMPGLTLQVTGTLLIAADAGLLGRSPLSLTCSNLTSSGVLRFGTNMTFSVTADTVLSNAFSIQADSAALFGRDLELAGPGSFISMDGADSLVGRDMLIRSGAVFSVFGKATNNTPRAWGARHTVARTLSLASGGWIHPYSELNNGGSPLFVCKNLAIEPLAGFNADVKGFTQNKGPAPGVNGSPAAGGGHGGRGGNSSIGRAGGSPNGRPYFPLNAGSGGGSATSGTGGTGGGVVRLEADSVSLNGTLTANGGSGSANTAGRETGGGAGGSIFLIMRTFSSGTQSVLSVRGATAATSSGGTVGAGGGGGGRIAIWSRATTTQVVRAETVSNNLIVAESSPFFKGTAVLTGGSGWQAGTNGTLFFLSLRNGTLFLVR